ncbi:hydrolase [Bombiscardovia apis]|uniref:Hydrolase n=1 Tax=Bombiscardovia apis TaxID=2932182 RepID=A0ABN6SF48_9BIFI|nr:HAD hydrolase-like protein [Bombiscardovia apis]BDR54641.1 hydrolase [Bombiscardovia apis]
MNPTGRKIVLLDLDGTLTASDPGILACVRKIFEELNLTVPSEAALHRFIGPSIAESLRINGVDETLIQPGIDIYRKYYNDIAAFDDPNHPGQMVPGRLCCTVYEGIPEQLRTLREAGYRLSIATCKPEYQAVPVCEHFGIASLVDDIFGASRDSSRSNKDQVIQYGFDQLEFDTQAGDRALMVGDRWTDADGARALGLDCLGCGWGYAEDKELSEHGCYHVIDQVSALSDTVQCYFK